MSTNGSTQTGSASTAAKASEPQPIPCPKCDPLGEEGIILEYQEITRTIYYGEALGEVDRNFDGTFGKIFLHWSTQDGLKDDHLATESSQLICETCNTMFDYEWT